MKVQAYECLKTQTNEMKSKKSLWALGYLRVVSQFMTEGKQRLPLLYKFRDTRNKKSSQALWAIANQKKYKPPSELILNKHTLFGSPKLDLFHPQDPDILTRLQTWRGSKTSSDCPRCSSNLAAKGTKRRVLLHSKPATTSKEIAKNKYLYFYALTSITCFLISSLRLALWLQRIIPFSCLLLVFIFKSRVVGSGIKQDGNQIERGSNIATLYFPQQFLCSFEKVILSHK